MKRSKSSAAHNSPKALPERAGRHASLTAPQVGPALGVVQWFRFGDREHVEQILSDLSALGVHQLRTGVSWADYHRPGGVEWYDWLMPRVAEAVEVLPCFMYTPPSIAMTPKSSAPPQNPQDYANFLDLAITRYGVFFNWLELWNDPSNINHWDWRLDPDWNIFCEMISKAAYWARQRGKRTVLAGVSPHNFSWLRLLCDRQVLEQIDVIGVRCYPGTWEHESEDLSTLVTTLGQRLASIGCARPIWITETGYSTWQNDEPRQLIQFAKLLDAPVERVYWYSAEDLHPNTIFQEGVLPDERQFHFGLKRTDRSPKLLYRVWSEGGPPAVRSFAGLAEGHIHNGHPKPVTNDDRQPKSKTKAHKTATSSATSPHATPRFSVKHDEQYILITGGAGFIGTNVAARLAEEGHQVLVYDNLSRPGVEQNLRWLLATYPGQITVDVADVRDPHSLRRAVTGASRIYHFAAQVAVTTSLSDPTSDFETNARGTLNLLEACRQLASSPPLLFTSTNKVYGNLENITLRRQRRRYAPADATARRHGIGESQPLDFHSPYGCSKGTADQYVLDFARCYDLPAVVFRMSCIYGPHQCGNEDQGWVAHFVRRALRDEPITFYGDGRQVRDLLYVDDLVEAMLLATEQQIGETAGQAFNIGGGPANAVSLLEVVSLIEELHQHAPAIRFAPWRSGDQRYYVSDTRAFQQVTSWKPKYGVKSGVEQLYHWLDQHGAELLAAATA